MALNNSTADALSAAICAANDITDPTTQGLWQNICRAIYAALKTDIQINVAVTSVTAVTPGGGASGPGTGTGVAL